MEANLDKTRDASLDYLKCIALLGLVIAHVTTKAFLFQIRCFDVNLLVIISAMLGCKSFEQSREDNKPKYIYILKYYIKRVSRLVFPTWIFVTFYFSLNHVFEFQYVTKNQILGTYLLQEVSIGFVWIIYVYLICALMMPLLIHMRV